MNNSLIKRTRHGVAMLAAMILVSAPAMASAQGFYAGLGVGQSKIDAVECSPDVQAAFFDISCNADNKDTAFKIFGGVHLPMQTQSRFSLAVELGYIDFGELSISGDDSLFGPLRASFEASGINLSAVGNLHVTDQFSFIGKVGVMRWDLDFTISDGFDSISDSESGSDVMFGIGAAFALMPELSARIEWERFEIDDEDTDLMSLSLIYHF